MKQQQNNKLGKFQSNQFGDQYLYLINGDIFDTDGSKSVFSTHYGHIFYTDSLYIIAGTDSGLLPNWIKSVGIPQGSRYLFVELPEVIQLLEHNSIFHEDEFELCTPDAVKDYLELPSSQRFAYHDRICLSSSQAVQQANYTEYLPFWRQLSNTVEHYCWQMKNAFSLHLHTNYQLQNLSDNQLSALKLKDVFCGKTAVLLAGGPSLDNYIDWIKKNRDKVVITAVSRICRFLLSVNIKPDIIVSVDPYPYNQIVSKEIHAFKDSALLVNGNFLNPDLLSCWQGHKAYIGPRFPWKTKKEPGYLAINGPTVTNVAYGLLVEMGFKQIVLIGADFCFSPDGFTHAKESGERDVGSMPMKGKYRIETNSGQSAETTNHYLQAALEIQETAKTALQCGCETINPSPHSMKLANVTYLSLDNLTIDHLDESACFTIQRGLSLTSMEDRSDFNKNLLKEVDHMLEELREIHKLAKNALTYNQKIYANSNNAPNMNYQQKMDRIEECINSKYRNSSDFIKRYGIQHFTAIIRINNEKKRNHKETELAGNVYYQAYIKTILELKDILHFSRARIMSRLEEEKEPPNIGRLLDLWVESNQHGRAVQWKHNHKQCIQQAAEHNLKRFLSIDEYYQQSLSELERTLKSGTSIEASLEGAQGKALECLINKDIEGLRLIHNALETHIEKVQAQQLKQITQAYLLELTESRADAIECYETISEGPYTFDVLKRLLCLYMEENNSSAMVKTLARLAVISSTFVPLLADMLCVVNEPEKAIELYTDYLLLTPSDLQSMFKLGKLYQQQGSTEGVEWAMRYILEKDPNFDEAKKLLAEAS